MPESSLTMHAGSNDDRAIFVDDPMKTLDEVDADVQHCRSILSGIWHASVTTPAFEDELQLKLAHALVCQFLHSGHLPNLQEAGSIYQRVMESPRSDTHGRLAGITGHGVVQFLTFELDGDLAKIDSSIHHLTEALELASQESCAYPYIETQLGHALELRFRVTGTSADLEEATALQKHAMEATQKPHPFHALCLFNVAELQIRLYTNGDDSARLHHAIDYFAASLATRPQGHRDRHAALHGSGLTRLLLHERTSDPHDLHDAAKYLHEAIDCCPEGHPSRGLWLTTYAVSIKRLHMISNDSLELDQAVDLNRQALALLPVGRPQRDRPLTNLANCLSMRGTARADWGDFDECVEIFRECLAITGHPARARNLINLENQLHMRYQALGSINDLSGAAELLEKALDILPQDHYHHDGALLNLISVQLDKFNTGGHAHDLIKAVRLSDEWVDSSKHATSILQSSFLGVAAEAHLASYMYFGDVSNLKDAVQLLSIAQGLVPACRRHHTLCELASAQRLLYCHTQEEEHLNAAVNALCQASLVVNGTHPDHSMLLSRKAHLHLFVGTEQFDPELALNMLLKAVRACERHPHFRLSEVLPVLEAYEAMSSVERVKSSHWTLVLEVYESACALLPQVAYLGLDMRSSLQVLSKADTIGTRAATYAVSQDKIARAVELVEETHAVFWTQHLRLRTDFDNLPDEAGNHFKRISQQLELVQKGGVDAQPLGESGAIVSDVISKQWSLSQQLEDILRNVRLQPGLERFMLHDTYSNLSNVASAGPVVILLQHDMWAYALVIRTPGAPPLKVTLPGVNNHGAVPRGMRVSEPLNNGSSEDLLPHIWGGIMRPIVLALGLKQAQGRQRPRVWICATGLFVHLPVHAAGTYQKNVRDDFTPCVSQYLVCSYTPTISALLRARTRIVPLERTRVKALLAAAPRPAKWPPLPNAQLEVNGIQAVISTCAPCHEERAICSSVEDVLRQVEGATILHLACHGFQRQGHPLESGFVLQDGILTVSQLMSLNLPHAFLAFLSACESARSDERQPNQAIALATTMLFAGFKSVIGTMWAMGDVDGPVVAAKIYGELFKPGVNVLDPEVVPYALDEVTQEMRRQGLHMTRWATYTHLGV